MDVGHRRVGVRAARFLALEAKARTLVNMYLVHVLRYGVHNITS
jgi:hypothetical protein